MEKLEVILRIPEIDRLLETANEEHVNTVSIDNTQEEKEYLEDIDNNLVSDVHYVNSIVQEVIELLESRGCDVAKYL